MALFKDTVALEACPAKTAESVSYGATFAVLAWLIVSNYSGFGYDGPDSDSLLSSEPGTTVEEQAGLPASPTLTASAIAEPSGSVTLSTDEQHPAAMATESETPYTKLEDLAAWHNGLQSSRQAVAHPGFRDISASAWRPEPVAETQLAKSYSTELSLPLPLIDTEALLQAGGGSELARTEEDDAPRPIEEITVTGSETSRLIARPDNIRRPQLPRPYRAQEIQRSLILPPRIQALRP